jgi:glycosyltransferase involved in cell wall biosynthesis
MKHNPLVSIIMPTFNSEKTIKFSLESIAAQEYPKESVELLVVDGGSTDKTLKIAKEFGARIINNSKVQQEYAKHLGVLSSKGDYSIFLDSDEVFENDQAIKNRVDLFLRDSSIKMVHSGGYHKPEGYSFINDYINYFSDPFVFFMNGVSSEADLFISSLKKRYKKYVENDNYVEFIFDEKTPLPVVDLCAGNTIDSNFLKSEFSEDMKDPLFVPQIFYSIVKKTGKTAVLKNDPIIHYSADSLKKFINKIRWRVVANIHYKSIPGTGFSNREFYQPLSYRLKKYLFIPYSLSIIPPLLVSIYHTYKCRKMFFLVHWILTVYTGILIVYHYILKVLFIKPVLKTYGSGTKRLNL